MSYKREFGDAIDFNEHAAVWDAVSLFGTLHKALNLFGDLQALSYGDHNLAVRAMAEQELKLMREDIMVALGGTVQVESAPVTEVVDVTPPDFEPLMGTRPLSVPAGPVGALQVEDAIEIVLDLARGNMLDGNQVDRDPDLESEAKKQEEAVNVIEDFFCNVAPENRLLDLKEILMKLGNQMVQRHAFGPGAIPHLLDAIPSDRSTIPATIFAEWLNKHVLARDTLRSLGLEWKMPALDNSICVTLDDQVQGLAEINDGPSAHPHSEPHKVSEPSDLDLYRENQRLADENWKLRKANDKALEQVYHVCRMLDGRGYHGKTLMERVTALLDKEAELRMRSFKLKPDA